MPENEIRRVTIRLSRPMVALLAATGLVLALLTTLGSWTLLGASLAFDDVEELERRNLELARANEELESRLWDLQARLAEYEQRTRELALVAGVELTPPSRGLGGHEPESLATGQRVGDLSRRGLRLDNLLDSVERRLTSTPRFFPTRGELTSRFGFRIDPLTGERSFHRGIDIGTDPDLAVRAAASGSVLLARRKGALGNAVHLAHEFGLATRYGHLSRIAVEPGQTVEQGDVLGYVGRTGRATGYHLHFEVLRDGRPVDPLGYLESRLGGP